ncbi:MAG: tRNA pseudouridine(55) synthase TruB [Flexilinea sp.]
MRDEDSRKLKSTISGVMVIDKPVGKTSHDVVQFVRKGTGLRRIGHTGTLDPRASGVLVVLIGPAVRLSEYLQTDSKRYEANIHLGATSDTYDSDGVIQSTGFEKTITEDQVLETIKQFTGEFEQIPPAYSAIKVQGRRAYALARKGLEVKLPSRKVNVYSFDLVEYNPPEIAVDIFCSSGTYIRSIAHEIGKVLGCGAYLSGLRRTVSGHFSLRDAITLPDLQICFNEGTWYQYLIPAAESLGNMKEVLLNLDMEAEIRHGRRIPAESNEFPIAKGVSGQGELIALLENCPDTTEWQPKKVFYL